MSGSRGTLLLVGPGGFVGPWLTRATLAAGWRVIGFSRHPKIAGLPAGARYTPVVGDVNDASACGRWVDSAEAVIFNAAYLPIDYSAADEADACLRTNALAPLAILTRLSARPKPFVYISTAQGYVVGERPAAETDMVFPARRAAYYLGSKLLGDLFTEHHRVMHRIPAAVLRLGSLYGPGLNRGMIARFIGQAVRSESIKLQDGGRHIADLTFVADAAQVALATLDRGAVGIFNVGSGSATTALDAARYVINAAARPESLLEIEPAGHGVGGGFSALDISRARRELGFVPTLPEQGLRRTVEEWLP